VTSHPSHPLDLPLLRSISTFRRQVKTFCSSLPTDTGIQTDDCFVGGDAPSVFSRGHNTNDSVTVTVTVLTSSLLQINLRSSLLGTVGDV